MDKNIYENMVIKDFDDDTSLIDSFIKFASLINIFSKYDSVSIYGKAEFIHRIFIKLIRDYNFKIGSIDFSRDYFDEEYDLEYCLRIYNDMLIVIERAYNDDFKPYHIDGIVFMNQDDCCQELIDNALKNEAKIILFGFSDESDISSGDNKITVKCELDADEALKTINEMERKMVHISKIFDELDQWQKLIRW